MQLVLLAGAHYTENDRLTETLQRNADNFASRGIAVPKPETYRGLMRDTLNAMHRAPVSEDAREVLLDTILAEFPSERPDRVILSDPNFFRTAGTAVQKGMFYASAPQRMAYMAELFPEDEIEIFMALRNPAAILPIFHSVAMHPNDAQFWGDRGPDDLRWSEMLSALRHRVPEIPVTVWCNEDLPLIWGQVIRDLAGLGEDEKILGAFDLLMTIMSVEGMQRFRAYLGNHEQISEPQKRRVIAAFLDKFALEDQIEEELDMIGWTDELVDDLSDAYDDDLATIEAIPGVRLILP